MLRSVKDLTVTPAAFFQRTLWYTAVLLIVVSGKTLGQERIELTSPDDRIVVQFTLDDGRPTYAVSVGGRPVLAESRLGFALRDAAPLDRDFRVLAVRRSEHDASWKPVYGERNEIRDRYRQAEIDLADSQEKPRRVTLRLRAYDEGVAFCYHFPEQEGLGDFVIDSELTQFRFAADHPCWPVYSAQGVYSRATLGAVKPNCERPLVVAAADGLYVAVGEARLVDFARMRLQPDASAAHTLRAHLGSTVVCRAPMTTPWRFLLVGDSPGQLLERNYLLLNLNEPCAIGDTSWIQPGKVIREVTLTTQGGKACVDFAVSQGLQFVEFDAGWYGHEYHDDSDATTVTVDPARSPGPLDLADVIHYADQRGIGIILYVNRRALERQLDTILPLYRQWGVRGVKYGFVQVGSQQWTAWLHEAVRKAAEHRLMVDIHDEYRPTGYERTYPNLMTQEGIGGDETSPTNQQTLTILFTRMIAGAADNTVCYYDSRVERNASHAYQLAKLVCLYSPWQFVFWYDRPAGSPGAKGGAGGQRGTIGDEPELEFYRHVPTVWDETRVIHGAIGEYAVIARRSGQEWYVGAMNDDQPRTLPLRLDFLDPNQRYTAHVYSDDPNVQTRTRVRIDRIPVDAQTSLDIQLAPRCGQAIRLSPVE
ncbi:MAG: glycoside hydrolase family 97 N-terminal domain-containing protein [Pirellulaceae bacterium]|nr:glycoside hydrolase family 97 N-terminal domain-containing protein [Pirellulaceae bacterium]